jgi:hypothetical protein
MARACEYCQTMQQYICDPDDHCGMCPAGQREQQKENRQTLRREEAKNGREQLY